MGKSVLFVCFGNLCRSTMAEALFRDFIKQKGEEDKWKVDSAGHGDWHLGKTPEPRTLEVLEDNGITGYTHTARLITPEDFKKFDYILGMDDYNLRNLTALKPADSKCKIQVLGDYDPEGSKEIYDPYFSNCKDSYVEVYDQCFRSCKAFLDSESKSS